MAVVETGLGAAPAPPKETQPTGALAGGAPPCCPCPSPCPCPCCPPTGTEGKLTEPRFWSVGTDGN